jgi:small-conductance mechanosensitive channel
VIETLRKLSIRLALAALWPLYFMLLSVAARTGPWPRDIGRPLSFVLAVLAGTMLISSLLRTLFRKDGWLQGAFEFPLDVVRQLRRGKLALLISASAFLIPEELLTRGLITPAGRTLAVPTICHLLIIGFEITIWVGLARLLRPRAPVCAWLATSPEHIGWVGRKRRAVRIVMLAALAVVIGLEIRGYGYSARRLAMAGVQSILLIGSCWVVHRLAVTLLANHTWRWLRRETRIAAKTNDDSLAPPSDLPVRIRRLVDWGVPILGGLIGLWVWDVDLALFNYIGEQAVWHISSEPPVAITVANVVTSLLVFLGTAGAWRYLSTIFALCVYPRMPEDPGIRFAVLTLCRYLVLAVGVLAGLSAIHLGFDKIGVVLAALGVGLGFGLQEIVSNFVSGIILLIERPIRVGDVVTVASMTGKIDRINIRATTLINADNQSLIIPNREFITGNLVNWTHKDKIIRFSIQINVARGSDPDRVAELLLELARADSDVLGNPVPTAYLDAFGASCLGFLLHVHVPDPSYPGKVRHRLCAQIQRRFGEEGIEIPLPLHELRFASAPVEVPAPTVEVASGKRLDIGKPTPPSPHGHATNGARTH